MSGRQLPYNVPVASRYGAPMGRPNEGPSDDAYLAFRWRRVPLDPYDGGGAYWGFGDTLWCFWTPDRSVIRYVRHKSWGVAQEIVREEFPQADFLALNG